MTQSDRSLTHLVAIALSSAYSAADWLLLHQWPMSCSSSMYYMLTAANLWLYWQLLIIVTLTLPYPLPLPCQSVRELSWQDLYLSIKIIYIYVVRLFCT